MTLKEFEAILKEDPKLQQKLVEAMEAIPAGSACDKAAALSELIRSLGYDVPADEIALKLIGAQPLDDRELEAVAGGKELVMLCGEHHQAGMQEKCTHHFKQGSWCSAAEICGSTQTASGR